MDLALFDGFIFGVPIFKELNESRIQVTHEFLNFNESLFSPFFSMLVL